MTSRGERPLRRRISSPGRRPDRSAADDSETATTLGAVVTLGADIVPGYPVPLALQAAGPLALQAPVAWTSCPSTECCSPSRGGSVPGWRRRSRPWPGWSGSSSRPSTATTRSSTTVTWWTSSGPRGWSSSTMSTRCRPGAPLMLSAHGSAPEVVVAARTNGRVVVDAVCPLVTKVHHELKVRARKGYTVLYVGHHGHEEAVGTMAVAPEAVRLLERAEDVDELGDLGLDSARATATGRPRTGPGGPAGPDHPQPRRVGGDRRPGPATVSRPVDAQPERPVLRHHQPAGGAQGHGRPGRRGGGDRLGELLQHRGPRTGGGGLRMSPGGPGQRRFRAARRPRRNRRCHRRGVGARGPGRRGAGTAQSGARRPAVPGHRGRGVLPSSARAA